MKRIRNLGILGLAFCLLAVLLAPTDWHTVITLVLQFLLPGLAWGLALSRPEDEWSEQMIVGLGVACFAGSFAVLLMHYWPGPLPRTPFRLFQVAILLIPVATVLVRRRLPMENRPHSWGVLIVLAIAICLRVAQLAYNEIEGDEAVVLLRAAKAIGGRDDILFWHKKGPAEILLSIWVWHARGSINEAGVRLPFTLMGTMGLVGVYLLGRRLLGKQTAWLAVALLAVNGYLVAFARIVQYQSIVFCMTVLALLSLERGRRRDIFLAGVFIGFGTLAHYDALLAMPALVYWLMRKTNEHAKSHFWLSALVAVSGFVIVVAPFYLPFALSSGFPTAWSYLAGDRLGTGMLHNNFGDFIRLDGFYNSTYYLFGIMALLLIAGLREWRRWPAWTRPIILVLLTASVTVCVWPSFWNRPPIDLSLFPFCLLLTLALCAPEIPSTRRLVWLWFGVPFIFYFFVVKDPRTHVYTLFPGLTLLAADTLAAGWRLAQRRPSLLRYSATTAMLCIYSLAAGYIYIAFIRTSPEYRGAYPAGRSPLYWTLSDDIPDQGYFGFPHHAGWKVIGQLYATGELDGVYASNEISRITNWYTRYAPRTHCSRPKYYYIAEDALDPVPIPMDTLGEEYGLVGIVTVNDKPRLRLYQRDTNVDTPVPYRAEEFEDVYDARSTPEVWVRGPQPSALVPTDARFGEKIRLVGYTLSHTQTSPDGTLYLTLFWEADKTVEENNVVFVHLICAGEQRGTGDSLPDCTAQPTPLWLPGEIVLDLHEVSVHSDTPVGTCDLFVGMYDLFTKERVPAYLSGERVQGDTLYLSSVEILAAPASSLRAPLQHSLDYEKKQ